MRAREFLIEAAYDSMIASMRQRYPQFAADINWAKTILKRQDRVVWYLNVLKKYIADPGILDWVRKPELESFQADLEHYLGQNIPAIQNFQFTPGLQPRELLLQLANLEREWQVRQKKSAPPRIQPGDQELAKFQDGTAWWLLDRAYCEEEGRSGQHCGNVVGKHKRDQRILSLRGSDGHVILTFVLEPDGTLGEMKARGNQKPSERYHPHIMSLLLSKHIKGITGQGFLPDMNFSIFDLDDEYLRQLHAVKPRLIKNQIQITPAEILNAPPWVRQVPEYRELAREYPALDGLLADSSMASWTNAIRENPELILYAPADYPDYEEQLLKFLSDKNYAPLLLKVRRQYRRNTQFLTRLLQSNPEYIRAVPVDSPGYNELATTAIRADGFIIDQIPREAWTREMVLQALQQKDYDPAVLRKLPDHLRTFEIYRAAMDHPKLREDQDMFELVPKPPGKLSPEQYYELAVLAANRGSVVPLIVFGRNSNQYSPKELKELAQITVRKNGKAINYVPVRDIDYDLSLLAVSQNGYALRDLIDESIPDKFSPDEQYELISTAVENSPGLIHFIDTYSPFENMSWDQQHIIYWVAVKKSGIVLDGVPREHQTPDILAAAVRENGRALEYVDVRDYTFQLIRAALENNGIAVRYYMPDNNKITHEQEIQLYKTAVTQDPNALLILRDTYDDVYDASDQDWFEVCLTAYQRWGQRALYNMRADMAERVKNS